MRRGELSTVGTTDIGVHALNNDTGTGVGSVARCERCGHRHTDATAHVQRAEDLVPQSDARTLQLHTGHCSQVEHLNELLAVLIHEEADSVLM